MQTAIVVAVEPDVKPLGLGGNLRSNLKEVSRLGYNGIELFVRDPERIDVEEIRKLAEKFNLSIPAIGTGLTYTIYGLSLSSSRESIRKKAIKRIRNYLEIARKLYSRVIVGSIKGKVDDYQSGIRNLRGSLAICAGLAEEMETPILIEPLNRYESNLINTLDEAIELREEVDSSMVGLMADTFHMNIEERSIYNSLIKAKGYLEHIHFADSNRQAPGQGHLDFNKIMHALKEIDYKRFITAEILPLPNQYEAARLTIEFLRIMRN